jgi:peptide/nickel transport system ATP-binding protein
VSALLEVARLSVAFRTSRGLLPVVSEVGFAVAPGRALGLVGESGSGKSVTALALLGLHDPASTVVEGSVRLRGRELLGQPERAWRAVRGAEVALVFQDPLAALDPMQRLEAQVGEALTVHRRLDRAARRAAVVALLGEVGLPGAAQLVDAYPHQLSGGMRQRAMIAAALAGGPGLLVADEPTTALDVTLQAQLMELLGRLVRARGMGLLLISHDLGLVAERCDEVAVLYAGRLVERGPVGQVFEHPAHPYTAGLVASSPRLGDARERLQEIAGAVPDLAALPPGCRFSPRCPLAQARCRQQEPAWQPGDGERGHRCHFPLGGAA